MTLIKETDFGTPLNFNSPEWPSPLVGEGGLRHLGRKTEEGAVSARSGFKQPTC